MESDMHLPKSLRSQSGVGLIEVMVAVFVLAIGLLGLASLQASALRKGQSGLSRSQAVVAIYSILDSMKANRKSALAGDYNVALTSPCAINTNPGTLAQRDIANWLTGMPAAMGGGACGGVNVVAGANGIGKATVTVQWDDRVGGGASQQPGTPQTLTMQANL